MKSGLQSLQSSRSTEETVWETHQLVGMEIPVKTNSINCVFTVIGLRGECSIVVTYAT